MLTILLNKYVCIEKMKTEGENERLILEAAEAEFLEKGYNGAKTTSIAKRAGVTHAMLHYYYRTKENLFDMVFREKVRILATSFEQILSDGLSFEEAITNFIHAHFDFLRQNPRLLNFVYNEVLSNKENRDMLHKSVFPILSKVYAKMEELVEDEVAKGVIGPIKPLDLILNIVSLNVITFMTYPVMKEFAADQSDEFYTRVLEEREESNVRFILNALKK